MKTLLRILILALVSACLPAAFGAQAVLVVTNTKAGVTIISKTNYPTVVLKDADASQFYSGTLQFGIGSSAHFTNPIISGTFQMLSLTTQSVVGTDANGYLVPVTVITSDWVPYAQALSNGLVIQSNALAGLSNYAFSLSNQMLALTNQVAVVRAGLTTVSNGLGSVSNGLVVVSNGFVGLSNSVVLNAAGLGTVSNGLGTLSNSVTVINAGLGALSNLVLLKSAYFTNTFDANQFTITDQTNVHLANGLRATNATILGGTTLGTAQATNDFQTVNGRLNIQTNALITLPSASQSIWGVTAGNLAGYRNDGGTAVLSYSLASILEGNQLVGVTGGIQTNIDNRTPLLFSTQMSNYVYTAVFTNVILKGVVAIPLLATQKVVAVDALGNLSTTTIASGAGTAGALVNSNLMATTAGQLVQFLGTDKTNTGPVTVGAGLTLLGGTLSVTNSTNNLLVNPAGLVLNTVYTNGTNVMLVQASGVLSPTVTANAQVRFYVESPAGTFNAGAPARLGLGAIVTHDIPFFAQVPPNMRFYPTNESDVGASASLTGGFTNILTGGLGGGSSGGSGTAYSFDPQFTLTGSNPTNISFSSGAGVTNLTGKGTTVITNLVAWTNVLSQTANVTITTNENLVILSATGTTTNLIATLPDATKCPGHEITIKRDDAGFTNVVTITNFPGQTVDGMLAFGIYQRGQCVWVRSDGANWRITAMSPAVGNNFVTRGTTGAAGSAWMGMQHSAGSATAVSGPAITTNTVRCWPIIIPRMLTIDMLGIVVQGQVTGAQCRLGLYADDGNGYPGMLVYDVGQITNAPLNGLSAGSNSTVTILPGLYYLAHTVTSPQSGIWGYAVGEIPILLPEDFAGGQQTTVSWTIAQTYTNFPNPFPLGGTRANAIILRVGYHASN